VKHGESQNNAWKYQLIIIKIEQTYYGALNLLDPDLILEKYSTGNGENTVKFVENLQKKMSGKDC
jgi:hypothetical protein